MEKATHATPPFETRVRDLWKKGCLPERDSIVSQPPSCLDVPPSMFCPGVFTSVLLQPSVSPVPSSFIRRVR